MTGIGISVPETQSTSNTHTGYTFPNSWDLTSKTELIAWLRTSADRLIHRAKGEPDRRERDRLLRMAAAAVETAGWYASQGGAL